MAKKNDKPKISLVRVGYNGDMAKFDKFIESMIHDYLKAEQDSMHRIAGGVSVERVENDDKSA